MIQTRDALRDADAGQAARALDFLAGKFGMAATAATEQTVIIVVQVQVGGRPLSMVVLVDRVLEVLNVEAGAIEPPPDLGQASIDGDFLLGVGKAAHRVVFLLDIAKVLTGHEATALAGVAN